MVRKKHTTKKSKSKRVAETEICEEKRKAKSEKKAKGKKRKSIE